MSEPNDEPRVEILDVGGRRRQEDADRGQPLPPLHLDDQPPGEDRAQPLSWHRWTALGATLVVGLVAGILISNARNDAAESAAAAEKVNLIADVPTFNQVGEESLSMLIQLNNAGPLDVEIFSVHPRGWELMDGAPAPSPRTARPGEWMTATSVVVPDCDANVLPNTVEIAVLSESGESTVGVPLPANSDLSDARGLICAEVESIGVGATGLRAFSTAGDRLTMTIRLQVFRPAAASGEPFGIAQVSADVAGFRIVASSAPLTFAATGAADVEVVWEVYDCPRRQNLGNVPLRVDVIDDEGRTFVERPAAPGEAISALARFGEAQCGA